MQAFNLSCGQHITIDVEFLDFMERHSVDNLLLPVYDDEESYSFNC